MNSRFNLTNYGNSYSWFRHPFNETQFNEDEIAGMDVITHDTFHFIFNKKYQIFYYPYKDAKEAGRILDKFSKHFMEFSYLNNIKKKQIEIKYFKDDFPKLYHLYSKQLKIVYKDKLHQENKLDQNNQSLINTPAYDTSNIFPEFTFSNIDSEFTNQILNDYNNLEIAPENFVDAGPLTAKELQYLTYAFDDMEPINLQTEISPQNIFENLANLDDKDQMQTKELTENELSPSVSPNQSKTQELMHADTDANELSSSNNLLLSNEIPAPSTQLNLLTESTILQEENLFIFSKTSSATTKDTQDSKEIAGIEFRTQNTTYVFSYKKNCFYFEYANSTQLNDLRDWMYYNFKFIQLNNDCKLKCLEWHCTPQEFISCCQLYRNSITLLYRTKADKLSHDSNSFSQRTDNSLPTAAPLIDNSFHSTNNVTENVQKLLTNLFTSTTTEVNAFDKIYNEKTNSFGLFSPSYPFNEKTGTVATDFGQEELEPEPLVIAGVNFRTEFANFCFNCIEGKFYLDCRPYKSISSVKKCLTDEFNELTFYIDDNNKQIEWVPQTSDINFYRSHYKEFIDFFYKRKDIPSTISNTVNDNDFLTMLLPTTIEILNNNQSYLFFLQINDLVYIHKLSGECNASDLSQVFNNIFKKQFFATGIFSASMNMIQFTVFNLIRLKHEEAFLKFFKNKGDNIQVSIPKKWFSNDLSSETISHFENSARVPHTLSSIFKNNQNSATQNTTISKPPVWQNLLNRILTQSPNSLDTSSVDNNKKRKSPPR